MPTTPTGSARRHPAQRALPQHHGAFTDVSRTSGADVQVRGNGCVAADLNGDGYTDLYVTAAGNDALLWNDGHGHFTEGALAAGITAWGWHAGATVGDVNGDGRPDVFVAGYADVNAPVDTAFGFPKNYAGVRDLLYLNRGNDKHGHATFEEVGRKLHIDAGTPEHGLGAVFTDANGDGRLDLYVANDTEPNRLYLNVPGPAASRPTRWGSASGSRSGPSRRASQTRMRAWGSPPPTTAATAGPTCSSPTPTSSCMPSSAASRATDGTPHFADARSDIAPAFDTSLAGWGVSWVDLDNDGNLDLVVANGAIPITALAEERPADSGIREPDRPRTSR